MVADAYGAAKDRHPLLGSACRLAERCVCGLTTRALDHAQPLLEHLQPQCESSHRHPHLSISFLAMHDPYPHGPPASSPQVAACGVQRHAWQGQLWIPAQSLSQLRSP